jgi:ABC-type multidrug transport system permease subunit
MQFLAVTTACVATALAGRARLVLLRSRCAEIGRRSQRIVTARVGQSPIVSVKQEEINAHNLRYIEFLLPGLIALSIMQMAVFSVAFVFTQYKEKGVLKRLLATPMRPIHFVLSNAITRLLVSIAQAAIFIVLGLVLFGVHVVGSYLLLALAVILGAFMFLGLGFTISGLAKTTDTVPVRQVSDQSAYQESPFL